MIRNTAKWDILEFQARSRRAEQFMPRPAGVRIVPEAAAPVPSEWTHPNIGPANGVLLYFHGGGFVSGSPTIHRPLVASIVRSAGIRALSVDYRLAPQHPFPAALDDTTAVYRWLLGQGVPPGQIVLGGDSAGGNLVLATLLRLRDEGILLPAAAFCLSPVTDLTGNLPSRRELADVDPLLAPEASRWLDAYAAGVPLDQPLLSPLMADLHGLPPLLVQVGTLEILLDDSRLLAEKAVQAGVEVRLEVYPGMWHVFQLTSPFIPEARRAIESAAAFVREKVTNDHA